MNCPHCQAAVPRPTDRCSKCGRPLNLPGTDSVAFEDEPPTEFDLEARQFQHVECYITVEELEAEAVARFLNRRGFNARIEHAGAADGAAPQHRVRVPIAELGQAVALLEEAQQPQAPPEARPKPAPSPPPSGSEPEAGRPA